MQAIDLARKMLALLPQEYTLEQAEAVLDLAKSIARCHSFEVSADLERFLEISRSGGSADSTP